MSAPLSVLSLFAGVGGFDLGLESTGGFKTAAFCEINPFCRRVLAKHWPRVPCYDDVRTLTGERLAADGVPVDVICGGFPCQDISAAGKGAGINGAQSGLWSEYARIVGECGPDWVIVENSPVLRTRGADRVLGDLETLGYACWPFVVGAAHAGAPHRRKRVWILANARPAERRQISGVCRRVSGQHAVSARQETPSGPEPSGSQSAILPHANGAGLEVRFARDAGQQSPAFGSGAVLGDALRVGHGRTDDTVCTRRNSVVDAGWWAAEPAVGRVAHGVPNRVDRITALGNAVVPAIPAAIGRAIMRAMAA